MITYNLAKTMNDMLLLSTHSLDPCLWGGGSDQPVYLANSSITPAGFVHKSRGDSVVQLKRWCVGVAEGT